MDYLIRTDASETIGSGHVMRCLSLADAIMSNAIDLNEKAQVTFICANHSGHLRTMIREHSYTVIVIKPCDTQVKDAKECISKLKQNYDLLIVDHYGLAAEFETAMRMHCKHIMVIDDLADRHHHCDVLLDQNLLPNSDVRYQHFTNSNSINLLGPRYSLLRPEFCNRRTTKVTDSLRLLVFLGGADPANNSLKVLQSIALLSEPMEVDLVLGQQNPWNHEIIELFKEADWLTVHIQCDYMGKLMSEARMSVGAGGSSHWERCACSLPTLVMTVADNQLATTEHLASLGACINLGSAKEIELIDLSRQLLSLWQNEKMLLDLSDVAGDLVPISGTKSVIEQLNRFKPDVVHQGYIGDLNE